MRTHVFHYTIVGLVMLSLGLAAVLSWRTLASTPPGDTDNEESPLTTPPLAVSQDHGAGRPTPPLKPHPSDPMRLVPEDMLPPPPESASQARERLKMRRPTTAEIQQAIAKQFRDAEEVSFGFAIGESRAAEDRRFLDEAARVFQIQPTGREDWWIPSNVDLSLYNACSVSFGENAAYAISYTSDNTIYVWHKAEEGEFTYHMRSDGLFEVLVAYYFADVLQVLEQRFTQDQLRVNPTRILLLSTHEPHYHSYIETLKKTLPRHGDTVGKPEENASIQATHEQNNE